MPKRDFIIMTLPLFLLIFIDTLGGALLIPLLGGLFLNPTTSIVPQAMSVADRDLFYGITVAIYFICAFFAAPILGDLSDKYGRKQILFICLSGTFCGYVLSIIAVSQHNAWLLLLGRMIDGFTAGSMSIAQAAIIDVSNHKNKTVNLGYILFAVSLGYVIGPILAGILANNQIISWFNLTTPFYCAAILALINIIMLVTKYHNTKKQQKQQKIHYLTGFFAFITAFKQKKIRSLALIFLFMQLGWATYSQFVSLFLIQRYHFTLNQVSLFMLVLSFGYIITFFYALKKLTQRYSLFTLTIGAIAIMSLIMFIILFVHTPWAAWLTSIPAAMCLGIAYSALLSLFSNQVSQHQQGWIMGVTAAVGSFAFGMAGLITAEIAKFSSSAPIWLAATALTISFILIAATKIQRRKKIQWLWM